MWRKIIFEDSVNFPNDWILEKFCLSIWEITQIFRHFGNLENFPDTWVFGDVCSSCPSLAV